MKCQGVTESASDFLEHRLNRWARLGVLLHLMMCKACRAYVRQLRLTVRALHSLGRNTPSGPAPNEQLLEEFRKATRRDEDS